MVAINPPIAGQTVCGMKTEVFSRVCGYHRSVKNWNKGQQEQFKDRKNYNPEKKGTVK